ncbi:MAG: HAD-IA family hydrolase [Magnetococcales bacterium]|nr:HAD-IA family hydrolase [Magnetococcales bacterium]
MNPSLSQIRLVIFDCDGTLVDSLEGIHRVMNRAVVQAGLASGVSGYQVAGVVGLSMSEALESLFPDAPLLQRDLAIKLYKDHYKQLADGGLMPNALFPGVREALDWLRQRGFQLGMATGKSMRGVERTLAEHDLHGYFSYLKSADCAPSKPHPGMVLQIIDESGFSAREILMVGDTDFDMIMGRQAGVWTCAVTYGCHSRERLAAAKPDFWLDSMSGLSSLLI